MEPLTHVRPRPAVALPVAPALAHALQDAFWCPALGNGASALLELAPRLDLLAQRIEQLPVRTTLTRPMVGQYLCMLKALASTWTVQHRPSVQTGLDALLHFGASVCQPMAVEALAARCADNGRAALRVADALQRRLGTPLEVFGALGAALGADLAHMARASLELETDTRMVTARLQADQVHAFLLAQQLNTLQGKCDARLPAAAAGQDGGALETVRRQLDFLRAEQGATRAEADYLQSVLPTVSPYLVALDQLRGAILALVSGAAQLQAGQTGLKQVLAANPAAAAGAEQGLMDALPRWQALAAAAGCMGARAG